MKTLKPWVKLPTAWIEDGGLKNFRWKPGEGATNVASLMLLMVIAQHAEGSTGITKLTYDTLCIATGLSRTKVAQGLDVLIRRNIVKRSSANRSTYYLTSYDPKKGWAKLPALKLYSGDQIVAFRNFTLRNRTELESLKAYFTFVARRSREENVAIMTYDKIEEYAGIPRAWISRATSFLAACDLIRISQMPTGASGFGGVNTYRLTHIDPYRHNGTTGRSRQSYPETAFV